MRKLKKPTRTGSETFITCISRVNNPDLKVRLEAIAPEVEDASIAFDAAATRHSLHELPREVLVGGNVTAEEMGAVYTQRMVKKGSPGRVVYEEILGSPSQGRCPLCVQRTVATLDHHLPKAHYPVFMVTPTNLVPVCIDCNNAKRSSYPQTEEDVFLHPYYDDLDGERWLVANVVETAPAATLFRVVAPDTWNPTLAARVQNYFQMLELHVLYGSEAAEELANIRHELEMVYEVGGMETVRNHLRTREQSCAANYLNGWRTAAYNAWASSEWFCGGGFRG